MRYEIYVDGEHLYTAVKADIALIRFNQMFWRAEKEIKIVKIPFEQGGKPRVENDAALVGAVASSKAARQG
jgi:hypothetical protein